MEKNNRQNDYESKLNKLFEGRQLDRKGVLMPKTEVEHESSSEVNETKSEIKPNEETKSIRTDSLDALLNKDNNATVAKATGFDENIKTKTRVLIDVSKKGPIVDNGK